MKSEFTILRAVLLEYADMSPALPEKGNRKADIFPDVFFLCLRRTARNGADKRTKGRMADDLVSTFEK